MDLLQTLAGYRPCGTLIAIGGSAFCIFLVFFLPRTRMLVREHMIVIHAYRAWRKRRIKTDMWLARHEPYDMGCFDKPKCQKLLYWEHGALAIYMNLKGKATGMELNREVWLSRKLKYDSVPRLPDK